MSDIPRPRNNQGQNSNQNPHQGQVRQTNQNITRLPNGQLIFESDVETITDQMTGTSITRKIKDVQRDGVCANVFKLHEEGRSVYLELGGIKFKGTLHCTDCQDHDAYIHEWNKSLKGIIYRKWIMEDYVDEIIRRNS